jgi:hypothetical protein
MACEMRDPARTSHGQGLTLSAMAQSAAPAGGQARSKNWTFALIFVFELAPLDR